MFEYTDDVLVEQFKPGGTINTDSVTRLPALFVRKTARTVDHIAQVGNIIRVQGSGKELQVEYIFDETISPIANSTLEKLSDELKIHSFEFSRTHWAIKDVDLFKVLLRD